VILLLVAAFGVSTAIVVWLSVKAPIIEECDCEACRRGDARLSEAGGGGTPHDRREPRLPGEKPGQRPRTGAAESAGDDDPSPPAASRGGFVGLGGWTRPRHAEQAY
jgi:hypothetical protein